MIQLYKNIKERRQELGLTQLELAKRLGYANKSSISRVEKGLVDLPLAKVHEYASALNTTAVDLVGWDEPEPQDAKDIVEMIGDKVFFENMKKVYNMSNDKKGKVYSYIDFLNSQD